MEGVTLPYKNVRMGYSILHPPYKNVRVSYSIHIIIKRPKSIFYSYN